MIFYHIKYSLYVCIIVSSFISIISSTVITSYSIHYTKLYEVPCDGIILSAKSLFSDESILTGEAVPVEKYANHNSDRTDCLNLPNIAYMGTIITKGNAMCRAVSTGMSTQMGKVSGMLEDIKEELTPLQKKLDELGKIVAIICIVICVIVFLAGVIRGEPVFDMLMTGITIAIAAIRNNFV